MKRFAKGRAPVLAVGLALVAIALGIFLIRKSLGQTAPGEPGRESGLNVLLITIDTLRADAAGYTGNRNARTPVLDRLAAGGARFAAAYAHNTVTLPSHANILSGRLPFEHGVRDNAGGRFPATIETLATRLKAAGYRTGAFVSAFPLDARFGLARGFDVYDDRLGGASRPAFLEQERAGAQTVSLATRWMETGTNQPFFCWVHLYEPHYPYDPDYRSDVAAVDTALQPLLDPILNAGRAGRTFVVLTSDHGESLGEHGEATHGIFAYDATLRVPLVLYAPRLWAARNVDVPAFHVDLFPTILDAVGLTPPGHLAGRSLLGAVGGRRDERPLYFEALSGMLNRGWAPITGVVAKGFKYIELPIPELYDLSHDPGERHNLAVTSPEHVREMRSLLNQWPAKVGAAHAIAPAETAEARDRLRSLGYLSASAARAASYTEADDPKTLIALDGMLQEVIGLYLDGHLDEAITKCREVVARRPQMAVSLLHLAHLEREAGRLDAAIEALRRAHTLNPNDVQTAALLGSYLTEAGRPADAATLLEPYAAREDADQQVLETQALALARLRRVDAALAALDRARALNPTSAELLVHTGTVQLIAGRGDRANAAFEEAVALNPALPRAHSSLAALAAERGDRQRALVHWRQAAALDPAEFRTVLGISIGLIQRGRAREARPYLEFFAASAPPSLYAADIAKAREWLARPEQPPRGPR